MHSEVVLIDYRISKSQIIDIALRAYASYIVVYLHYISLQHKMTSISELLNNGIKELDVITKEFKRHITTAHLPTAASCKHFL